MAGKRYAIYELRRLISNVSRQEYTTLTPIECSRNLDTPKEEEGIVGTMEIYPS